MHDFVWEMPEAFVDQENGVTLRLLVKNEV
jgi:hypothetical protein